MNDKRASNAILGVLVRLGAPEFVRGMIFSERNIVLRQSLRVLPDHDAALEMINDVLAELWKQQVHPIVKQKRNHFCDFSFAFPLVILSHAFSSQTWNPIPCTLILHLPNGFCATMDFISSMLYALFNSM